MGACGCRKKTTFICWLEIAIWLGIKCWSFLWPHRPKPESVPPSNKSQFASTSTSETFLMQPPGMTSTPSESRLKMQHQKLSEVTGVVQLIMEALLPDSPGTLLEVMLCSREFFSIGAPLLYKDLDAITNYKIHLFLVSAFALDALENEPPKEHIVKHLRKVNCLTVDVARSLFRHASNLVDFSIEINSAEEDAEFWQVLQMAPKSLRKLKYLCAKGALANLPQRPLPPSLTSVEIGTRNPWGTMNPALFRFDPTIGHLLHGIAALPSLEEWTIDTIVPFNDLDSTFQCYPNLVSTCKGPYITEECLARVLHAHGSSFRPTRVDVNLLHADRDPTFYERWLNLELPQSITEMEVCCVHPEETVTLFLERLVCLPNLRKVQLKTIKDLPMGFLLARFPLIVDKLEHIRLVGKLVLPNGDVQNVDLQKFQNVTYY